MSLIPISIEMVLLGLLIGILKFLYGMWKTREWFSFIKEHQPSIDEDTDWWGYVIYKKYPYLALMVDTIIGSLTTYVIILFLNLFQIWG